MKKKLFTLLLLFASISIFAQNNVRSTRDGQLVDAPSINQRATATDFTVTFTDGTTGNLFATLNAGNSVVLDFFYTT